MKAPGDLLPRVGVAAVGIPAVFGAFHLGGWVLGCAVALVAALGAGEFYALARARGDRPFTVLGVLAAGGVVLAATAHPTFATFAPLVVWILLGLAAACLVLSLALRWPGGSPTAALASTLAGVVYVGIPLAFVIFLRDLPRGVPGVGDMGVLAPLAFVLLPLLVTWAGDTAAYFVGIAVGRVRLAPTVSPKKSVEGAVAGVLGAVGAAMLVSSWWLADFPGMEVPLGTAAWMGAIISVAGQTGDLVESALKREAGVKDSGRLLPGHGGFLDRLDALLWAFPITWVLLVATGIAGR